MQCDTSVTPDQGTTSGSQSHPTNFNHAQSGAGGRDRARGAARSWRRQRLGVPVAQLTAADGVVAVTGDPSRRVGYGELVGGRTFDAAARSATRSESRRASGRCSARPVPRVDMPAHGDRASSSSCTTCACAGMLHGRVVRPPEVGATLVSVDERSVAGLPGFVRSSSKELRRRRRARSRGRRCRRRATLKVDVDPGTGASRAARLLRLPAHGSRARHAASWIPATSTPQLRGRGDGRQGHVSASLPDARLDGHVVRGRGRAARPRDDLVVDAVGLSAAQHRRRCCSGCRPSSVRVVFTRGSGCYGINGADTVRTTPRCCRRRSAGRCACSSRVRTRWRGRTTASRT